jgi:cobalt/nickel transport system permease protein
VSEQSFVQGGNPHQTGFIGRLLSGLLHTMQHAHDAERMAAQAGWLQGLDARVKLGGLLLLIITAVAVHSLSALVLLLASGCVMARFSAISLRRMAVQAWLGVVLFTGTIALPALFLVPGQPLLTLWNGGPVLTAQGLRSACFLIARAETSASFALLAILSTPWPHLLKALRCFRVPLVMVAILGMTHRYVFVLLTAATQLFEARASRLMGPVSPRERRRQVASGAGVLLERSLHLAQEVHLAMLARGYRGEVRIMQDFQLGRQDAPAILLFLFLALAALGCQYLSLP